MRKWERARCSGSSFFFQAEDGIRDWSVTGVQTCALPISGAPGTDRSIGEDLGDHDRLAGGLERRDQPKMRPPGGSEERRVGKECRSRWSPHHEKKKEVR